MATHLRTEIVVDALQMSVARSNPAPGLVHHSDHGVQYTSLSFGKHLEEKEFLPSIGKVGSAYDNTLAESFVATLNEDRVFLRISLADAAGCEDSDLRVHRGLLQHEKEALCLRISESRRVRAGYTTEGRRCLTETCLPIRGKSSFCGLEPCSIAISLVRLCWWTAGWFGRCSGRCAGGEIGS